MNTKIIYTKKLANYLVRKGFKCLDTQINFKNPQFYVFIFEDTEELNKELENYLSHKEG